MLPTSESDAICGLVLHSHDYVETLELGDDGVKPGNHLNVARKGRAWVTVNGGCQPGDRLWVRAVSAGGSEILGGCEAADDGTDTIDCTNQGVFRTAAASGELAILEFDFTADAT